MAPMQFANLQGLAGLDKSISDYQQIQDTNQAKREEQRIAMNEMREIGRMAAERQGKSALKFGIAKIAASFIPGGKYISAGLSGIQAREAKKLWKKHAGKLGRHTGTFYGDAARDIKEEMKGKSRDISIGGDMLKSFIMSTALEKMKVPFKRNAAEGTLPETGDIVDAGSIGNLGSDPGFDFVSEFGYQPQTIGDFTLPNTGAIEDVTGAIEDVTGAIGDVAGATGDAAGAIGDATGWQELPWKDLSFGEKLQSAFGTQKPWAEGSGFPADYDFSDYLKQVVNIGSPLLESYGQYGGEEFDEYNVLDGLINR